MRRATQQPRRRRRRRRRRTAPASAAAAAVTALLLLALLSAPQAPSADAFQSGDGASAAALAVQSGRRKWGVAALVTGGGEDGRLDASSSSSSGGGGGGTILVLRASAGSTESSSASTEESFAARPAAAAAAAKKKKKKKRAALPEVQKPKLLSRRDELWENKLSELRSHVEKHGNADVSRSRSAPLAAWASRQRREYGARRRGEKSSMTEERAQKLDELGFRWETTSSRRRTRTRTTTTTTIGGASTVDDGPAASKADADGGKKRGGAPSAPAGREERWEVRLDELRLFRSEFGHADVPEQPDDDRWRELANWVKLQRVEYSRYRKGRSDGKGDDGDSTSVGVGISSSMTPARIAKLNDLDFTWDVHDRTWENRLSELEEYRAARGHCNVPLSHGSLGDWVQKVRINHRRLRSGREPTLPSLLTPERIRRLDDAGFDFDPHETRFQANLAELRRFREEYGHIEVGTKRGKLSNWFYRQRALYRKLLGGSDSTGITPSRRAALESSGFHPSMFDDPHDGHRSRPHGGGGGGGSANELDDSSLRPSSPRRARWEDRYDELLAYVSIHGHANVPYIQGPLGRWVKEQRFNCRNETRIALLNEAGFVWNVRDYAWWSRFRELEEYGAIHGHVNVPHSGGELGEWVAQQRRRYKRRVLRSCAVKKAAAAAAAAAAGTTTTNSNDDGAGTGAGTSPEEEHCEVDQEADGGSDDDGDGDGDDAWEGDDRLDDARRCALDEVGFVWDRGGEIKAGREEMWDRNFESLRRFREEYGNCRVPVGQDSSLCYWVNVQRRAFRGEGGGMSERRRKRMESIGFE